MDKEKITAAITGNGGPGLLTMLQVLFIAFKLAGIITWSWIAVLWPLLLQLGFILVLAIVLAIGYITLTKDGK